MALVIPIINLFTPFDALANYTISFIATGGDQVVAHEIEIENNRTQTQVYIQKQNVFQLQHSLTANTLTNGVEYRIRVRTYNQANTTSAWSDWMIFKCLTTPIVLITNITDGKINNQTYTFTGSYSQADDEPLQSYRYLLYNQHQALLQSFDEKFDVLLKQEMGGLENNTVIYIELKVITVNGVEASSGLVQVTPVYIQPTITTMLNLKNDKDKAAIQITANIIQIIGTATNYTYEDNDWINVKTGNVNFDEGFNLDGDFTLKLWLKDIVAEDIVILKLLGSQGYTDIKFYNNIFHAFKQVHTHDLVSHFISNSITLPTATNILYLQIQQVDDLLQLQCEIK